MGNRWEAGILPDLEHHRGALIVPQHVEFYRVFIAQLLEQREHGGGIFDFHAIDLFQDISLLQPDLFVETRGSNIVQSKSGHGAVGENGNSTRLRQQLGKIV